MNRGEALGKLDGAFDVLVIGGGATGTGAALDAVTRGYSTALVEAADFASATSSRSTKLIHGGVRYLQKGEISLVRESLHERANLLRNAPNLVTTLGFICPAYGCFDLPMYLAGFTAYDMLAGFSSFPRSRVLGRSGAAGISPDLRRRGLQGGIRYFDAQFDDARLALALARTAVDKGATVANYVRAERFLYENGRACGAVLRDGETGREVETRARVVINATGIFVDELRSLDDPGATPMLAHSRGSHVVFPADVYRGKDALLVPKTSDGRVLFVIPWQGAVVMGTTDIPVEGAELDVAATSDEIDFIIGQANQYLERPVDRKDALSAYAGLRPLVRGDAATTAKLSREHLVDVSASGIVTVTGGKWTTYRKMAQDTIDTAAREAGLAAATCVTARLALHDADRDALLALERADPSLSAQIDPRLALTRAEVVFAAREEGARTVEDVLSRRTRALFTNAGAALDAAAPVAAILANELGHDDAWRVKQVATFTQLAGDAMAFRRP